MRLYLVRHGEARPKDIDPDRHLTDKGRRDVRKTAAFLRPMAIKASAVWHSGKTRAAETADLFADSLTAKEGIVEHAGLAPDDPVGPVKKEVDSAVDDLVIAGHLPFLGKLASVLAAGSESADVVAFEEGSVVCLERNTDAAWRIVWAVSPDSLR